MWEYRILEHMPEFEQVVSLEIEVWGLDPRDAVPGNMLHAVAANGGLVIGAFDKQHLIGMALAFPARKAHKWILWSHMAGVHPHYQGQGIGFSLKQFQRTWALEHGYDVIGWTYDPIQRGNANFNLHQLGAVSATYHVNFYGEMTDAINAGLPSDRLEVSWHLSDKRVKKLSAGVSAPASAVSDSDLYPLLTADDQGLPGYQPLNNEGHRPAHCIVQIPSNLSELKRRYPDSAMVWRLATRQAFQEAFARGYVAEDFVTTDHQCGYILTAAASWYLYVLECGDQSLYTGITTDLARRLHQHNSGHGAAYTASRLPVRLVAAWEFPDRSLALKAEAAFKRQSRSQKAAFVMNRRPYRNAPFVEPAV